MKQKKEILITSLDMITINQSIWNNPIKIHPDKDQK